MAHKLSAAVRAARQKPGGSNVGKYPTVKTFAGPSGGAPKGSYPINTKDRAKSALKLAHNAPRPAGIRRAVVAKYPGLKKKSS
jgi:type IV secretory pathway TrbL component